MADTPKLSPLNDFGIIINIQLTDETTSVQTPCATGVVTGFIAASSAPDAPYVDATWSVPGVYVGAQVGRLPGDWLFPIDAAVLTIAKCRAAFLNPDGSTNTPYFVVQRANGVRQAVKLKYADVRMVGA